jgi:hypothetical protein
MRQPDPYGSKLALQADPYGGKPMPAAYRLGMGRQTTDPNRCTVCGKVCASRIGLVSHSRTHGS